MFVDPRGNGSLVADWEFVGRMVAYGVSLAGFCESSHSSLLLAGFCIFYEIKIFTISPLSLPPPPAELPAPSPAPKSSSTSNCRIYKINERLSELGWCRPPRFKINVKLKYLLPAVGLGIISPPKFFFFLKFRFWNDSTDSIRNGHGRPETVIAAWSGPEIGRRAGVPPCTPTMAAAEKREGLKCPEPLAWGMTPETYGELVAIISDSRILFPQSIQPIFLFFLSFFPLFLFPLFLPSFFFFPSFPCARPVSLPSTNPGSAWWQTRWESHQQKQTANQLLDAGSHSIHLPARRPFS